MLFAKLRRNEVRRRCSGGDGCDRRFFCRGSFSGWIVRECFQSWEVATTATLAFFYDQSPGQRVNATQFVAPSGPLLTRGWHGMPNAPVEDALPRTVTTGLRRGMRRGVKNDVALLQGCQSTNEGDAEPAGEPGGRHPQERQHQPGLAGGARHHPGEALSLPCSRRRSLPCGAAVSRIAETMHGGLS